MAREGRRSAEFPTFAEHQRVPHWEIGQALGILDMESGAKLAGSMFALYRGAGARLVRALTSFAMSRHGDAYEEIRPPTLALTETMISTGHLPKSADDMYEIQRDGLWAIPTGEVPLTSLRRGEILDEAELPVRLTAQTNCFRREAGSAGKDTRGVLRLHEFEKVELFAYCTPEQADEAHADILRRAEALLQELGLPYRLLELVHRRPRDRLGVHHRSRGVQSRRGPLARGLLGQLVPRLSGAPSQRALPHERGHHRARAHGEWFGARVGAYLGRAGRDVSPRGRIDATAPRARPVFRWRRDHSLRLSDLVAIPHAAHGRDVGRVLGFLLNQGAQALDVDIESFGVADVVVAPDAIDEHFSGEYPARDSRAAGEGVRTPSFEV